MRASRAADEIGVVVHGPEVIDSGFALTVLSLLEGWGRVDAVLGGTMGRVAVIDAGLEDRIEITRREIPSQSVRRLQRSADAIVLLNQAKNRESGLAFGSMVAVRSDATVPLIQVDSGGGFVATLYDGTPFEDTSAIDQSLARNLARSLGLDILAPLSLLPKTGRFGRAIRRRLAGAIPGENVSVNGIVVGRASNSTVEIVAQDGLIVAMRGVKPKMHGLEKLPPIDLESAILRSGDIRRTECVPRSLNRCGHQVVLVDHCAESTFEKAKDAGVVITVGDDTTAVAGDVLARLGVPQIGIVDGDPDILSHRTVTPSGSTIIRVRSGCDDLVGRLVKAEIFGGKTEKPLNGCDTEHLARKVKEIAGESFLSEIRFR